MSCPVFPKIETLYDRGDDFKVDTGRVRRPEFLVPSSWIVTEKIDGTNVRVSLEYQEGEAPPVGVGPRSEGEWAVRFYGRTENSQMPTFLLDYLQRAFTLDGLQSLWRCKKNCEKCSGLGKVKSQFDDCILSCPNIESYPIVLYGEGYGARIQKGGGDYRKEGNVSLRLFDVLIGGTWLRRADVEDVASQLGISPVPLITEQLWPIDSIVEVVKTGFGSYVALEEGTVGTQAEGVVAFTDPPLFDSRGRRLAWKLKTKDFA